MLCFNLPKKAVSWIQVGVSMLLIILALIFSFMPIITFDVADDEMRQMVLDFSNEFFGEEFSAELEENIHEVLPDTVEFSITKLVGSIGTIADTVGILMESESNPDAAEELKTLLLETEDGKQTIALLGAIGAIFTDAFSDDVNDMVEDLENAESEEEAASSALDKTIPMIFKGAVMVIALLFLLITACIAPIIFTIMTLVALIQLLSHITKPEAIAARLGKKLPGKLSLPIMIILLQAIFPTMHFGVGALGLLIVSIVCAVLNTVISRLRLYTSGDIKYLNIMQGVSILSIGAFMLFFFNIIKTGMFNSFITGNWAINIAQGVTALAEGYDVVSYGFIIDAVLVFLSIILLMRAVGYIESVLQRISCTEKRGRDGHLAAAIVMVLVCALPMFVKASQNSYDTVVGPDATVLGSYLDGMSLDGENALTLALVGAIIALVSEIALKVLKAVLCKDVSKEDMAAVVSGLALTPAEKAATEAVPAAAVVEEAVAEEAPATEETAEEAVAEEAPATEETAEEAVAEEAPATEETAEEAVAEEAPATEETAEEAVAEEVPATEETAEEAVAEEAPATEETAEEAVAEEAPATEETAEEAVAEEKKESDAE